jgi:hypothetical protein
MLNHGDYFLSHCHAISVVGRRNHPAKPGDLPFATPFIQAFGLKSNDYVTEKGKTLRIYILLAPLGWR